jgi:hypothetical protein
MEHVGNTGSEKAYKSFDWRPFCDDLKALATESQSFNLSQCLYYFLQETVSLWLKRVLFSGKPLVFLLT